jgi:hypothetical protein
MNSSDSSGAGTREIGGYFGLELGRHRSNPHAAALALNSARNCLLYLLLARRPARLHLPAYLCDSMIEPLQRAAVAYEFYNIDADLEVAGRPDLGRDELLLYVNYFGVKTSYCQRLAAQYGSALVLDNSQALFSPPLACAASLYSPRKFLGVVDGGYLHCGVVLDRALDRDVSWDSARHLVGRIDLGAAGFYADFRRSEQRLAGRPLRRMSALTEAILNSVDYDEARQTRRRNFLFLHAALGPSNRLRVDTAEIDGPMVYQYWTDDPTLRQGLLARRIYTATYWSEVTQRGSASDVEKDLAVQLIALSIDQRYELDDMRVVVEVIEAHSRARRSRRAGAGPCRAPEHQARGGLRALPAGPAVRRASFS